MTAGRRHPRSSSRRRIPATRRRAALGRGWVSQSVVSRSRTFSDYGEPSPACSKTTQPGGKTTSPGEKALYRGEESSPAGPRRCPNPPCSCIDTAKRRKLAARRSRAARHRPSREARRSGLARKRREDLRERDTGPPTRHSPAGKRHRTVRAVAGRVGLKGPEIPARAFGRRPEKPRKGASGASTSVEICGVTANPSRASVLLEETGTEP